MCLLLLVDDDPDVLGVLNGMLILAGHSVVATHDGRAAFELIETEDFELVITDLVMPNVNGWDIARKVKSKAPAIPVILLTGWAADYENEDLSERGVNLVLPKPVTLRKLTTGIRELIPTPSQDSVMV